VVERHFVLVGIRAVFFAAFLGNKMSTFRKKLGAYVFRSRDPGKIRGSVQRLEA